ncbi:MAG: hypothetical protein A2700_00105 [Candidatus Blackburnbacteria bacterium RIFCSPHIGHO2_01_FULL_44_64]|uniref:Glycosyltransferase subfamily 4-like N-terminal domain-containing protein n=1 Tax=Candidatus Blackburnbacteria bacterium RIFCSPHIGHO2_02_FULL_44_20 TaxID=1797516 RepID=A0A1G1V7X5_9BACT|nr:MAG: hypothetical protein A2700_00105 [Candidatus Blackburnbacteria bacterium RIFCSPHIGHO2_01_FULL_44_64]OGY11144.1 MAG: hypothetical protein A3E16_01250 [Candidatus Blackburnbacteria bacterium RIFCSPHIGHO2_12_FULL_44_25]OGY11539.1 MAG: hypothetical protein A3D26_03245 [Candidatus Blackburnbacteria bacterium RIFCSPHIGHO2_02_FULL_44_20]OGY14096.1 MAG: hypothetical protein A3A62_01910 [Candidatus Blackburnbacteria bacterium RIFCSPLOWO2_01_FULL_44_43]
MRTGIDISQVVYGTGVSQYTKYLVEAMLAIDQENEYILFGGALRRIGELQKTITLTQNAKLKTYPIPPTLAHILWNKLHVFPIENLTGHLDVFHSSDWTQPPSKAYKITTVHDLAPILFPETSNPDIVDAHRARLEWVKKEVDRVIAVSSATKKDLVEHLGFNPEKIVVIPEAGKPGMQKVHNNEVEDIRKKHKIAGPYLLAIGANPRKNLSNIGRAYASIKREYPDLKLVVVGSSWVKNPQQEGVIYTGSVSESELPALYGGAEALVYTTLYEGFGQPILEAMQMKCPVVTSNISSMPEVAGNAAVLVNPTEPEDIEKGIREVFKNPKKWTEKGKERAKQFSWQDTAKLTLRVYRGEL